MRLSCLPLLPALGYVAITAAHVYIFDPSITSTQHPGGRTLSPETARLVLAQRAGAEDYHIDRTLNAEEIDAINTYGSKTGLLGEDGSLRKAFLLHAPQREVEIDTGVLPRSPSFAISPPPATTLVKHLFFDLFTQADPAHTKAQRQQDTTLETRDGNMFYLATSPRDLAAKYTQLKDEGTWVITAILYPFQSQSSDWGTYSMPNAENPLYPRQKRQIYSEPEEPLSAEVFHTLTPENTSSVPTLAASNQTKPLEGILPACFSSMSSCQSSTRNCTGHGSCRLKFTDKDASSSGRACYSCQCSATVQTTDGKKQTTTWGGPACQKKDVSVEFWLIVLFTVALIFLVGFAVGTVWEMGSQELPSVIGAGVSGPVRKG